MKKYILAGIGLVLVIAVTVIYLGRENVKPLNINEVASDPSAFTGTLVVTGITYGYSRQDPNLFGVMDVKELQCQSQNCNKMILPVKYTGNLPAFGDEINMKGNFINTQDGYLFAAEEIKVLRSHKLGG